MAQLQSMGLLLWPSTQLGFHSRGVWEVETPAPSMILSHLVLGKICLFKTKGEKAGSDINMHIFTTYLSLN